MIVPDVIIHDDFLPADLHAALLDYVIAERERFEPAVTVGEEDGVTGAGYRLALIHPEGLGPLKRAFRGCIERALDGVAAELGTALPDQPRFEIELAVHRDGAYYKPHIDTHTQRAAAVRKYNRLISMVYYFCATPRRFSGGELAIYALGGGGEPARLIDPRDNRLVCFSSIAPHAVQPVSVPGDGFGDARYAINCWVNRARDGQS